MLFSDGFNQFFILRCSDLSVILISRCCFSSVCVWNVHRKHLLRIWFRFTIFCRLSTCTKMVRLSPHCLFNGPVYQLLVHSMLGIASFFSLSRIKFTFSKTKSKSYENKYLTSREYCHHNIQNARDFAQTLNFCSRANSLLSKIELHF